MWVGACIDGRSVNQRESNMLDWGLCILLSFTGKRELLED